MSAPRIAYVLRSFPKLSETFVLNELRALERAGASLEIFSLNRVRDPAPYAGLESLLDHTHYLDDLASGRNARIARVALRHPIRFRETRHFYKGIRAADPSLSFERAAILAAEVQRRNIQHLHAHFALDAAGQAMLAASLTGRSFSFTAHARDIYVHRHLLAEKLRRSAFAITVCEYNRKILAAYDSNLKREQIHVIPPALDLEGFLRAGDARAARDAERPFSIASVGRLVEKKGMIHLVEALDRLSQRNVAFRATIVGDGPERPRLVEAIERAGLTDRVALAGSLDAARVREVLAAADCFVLPCVRARDGDTDATPTVLGEAMAMGLPVVSTRLAGIPEIVPEDIGMLVDPGDIEALTGAIEKLARLSPQALLAVGLRGRARVEAHWNPDRGAARILELVDAAR